MTPQARRQEHTEGMQAGIDDAAAGRPNRLGVKGDTTRFVESDAWCKGYDYGYRWKSSGPGRFVEGRGA